MEKIADTCFTWLEELVLIPKQQLSWKNIGIQRKIMGPILQK